MANSKDQRALLIGGIALVAVGASLIVKAMMTMPGEMAILVPRTADWTRTEAFVIGVGFIFLGIYSAVFLRKRS